MSTTEISHEVNPELDSDNPGGAPESTSDGYTPRQITANDLEGSLDDAYAASMVVVDDGQLVTGTVVRVDRDEVLLDLSLIHI